MPLPYALRISLRSLARAPLLFGSAIVAIAIGVAAPTMMFTIADGALSELPVPEPEQLVSVDVIEPRGSYGLLQMDGRWFAALRDRQTTLEDVAAYTGQAYDVSGLDALPEQRSGARVTTNAFSVLRVAPVHGRDFTVSDVLPGAEPVVLISHDFWQGRLGGGEVVGKPLRLNGEPHTIIGVMPPGFAFPERHQLCTPFRPSDSDTSWPWVWVFGRLSQDVTLSQVNAELAAFGSGFAYEYDDWHDEAAFAAAPYSDAMIEPETRTFLAVMTLLFAFVLIIACVNVANLLIARAVARTQEVAVRAALGAGARRLALEQLGEALWIALPGAFAGLILSRIGVAALAREIETYLPFWVSFRLDSSVLLFTLGCMLLATLAAGMVPALQTLRVHPQEALQGGARGATFRIGRIGGVLLVLQIALSVSLLIVAGAATKGVLTLATGEAYQASTIATASWTLRGSRFNDDESIRLHMDAVLGRVGGHPGVEHAAAASHLPDVWSPWRRVALSGVDYESPAARPYVHQSIVTPGYFATLGRDPVRGRDFSPLDRDGAASVVVVNQPFVERYMPSGDPIGAQLIVDGVGGETLSLTVVGVVPHVGVSTEENDPPESIYLPFAQHPQQSMSIIARATHSAATLAADLRRIGSEVDGDVALQNAQTLQAVIHDMRRTERAFGILFITVGSAALLLAAVGLSGMMAWSVRQRRRELGIRAALGATPLRVTWTALRGSAAHLAIGGTVGATFGIRAAEAVRTVAILGIPPTDSTVLLAVPVVLVLVGALAAWAPARYAGSIPVVEAIRTE